MTLLRLTKILFSIILSFQTYISLAQTLNSGDIAFVGYNTDSPDSFSWIALNDIPQNEVIYFSEQGWTGSAWYVNSEFHIAWTSPTGGITCGTIIRISGAGATSGSYTGSFPSLSAGDQVLAYQGSNAATASPNFIAAIHGDYNSGDYNASTTWNSGTANNTSSSNVPTGLTNGTNCISLFPAPGPEIDNAKYNGSLTGTIASIRTSIHDPSNWIFDNGSAFSIEPGDYSPSVDCSTLPIELNGFDGRQDEGKTILKWQTTNEINNKGFEIETSLDGIEWKNIGFVEGNDVTNRSYNYSFIDKNPSAGINYYRLKQIDFDGDFEYSDLISVKIIFNDEIRIVPNPTQGEIELTGFESGTVMIYNSVGETVFNQYLEQSSINISDLSRGIYWITISNKGQFITEKIVKE